MLASQPAPADDWVTAPAPAASAGKDDWVTAPKSGPQAAPTGGEFGDLSAQPWARGEQPSPSETAPAGRIINAAADAYRDTPPLVTPQGEDLINQATGITGQTLINPALKVAGGVNAAAHAGMAALSQAAMEVFGEKGGRDALALLSTLPMAPETAHAMTLLKTMSPDIGAPSAPTGLTPRPRFISELTAPDVSELDPRNAIAALIQHDITENGPALPGRGMANQGIAEIGNAPNIDSAIAAAGKAIQAPVARPMSEWMTPISKAAPDASAPAPQSVGDYRAAEPEPMSVGAAASREQTPQTQIDLSTADMKANRRRAEMDELVAPPQANDKTIYVPGSFPTLAERTGDPEISQTENMIRQRNSGAFIGDGKPLTENNKARVAEYDANTVPDPTINTMKKDRQTQWDAMAGDLLPNAKSADLTPALDWAEGQLSDPRIQENDAVRRVLEDFHQRLFDDNGELKTDPAAVWGMHDHLQNMLAKAKDPLNMTGSEKFAEKQILAAKEYIDQAMNVATDNGFQAALASYAEASKAINAAVLLNDFRPKLTNAAGELQAANFHRFVVGLAKERGNPGIDQSMDISDATMRSLLNIDADLKRAGLIKLGAAAGSPTNLLGALAESAGINAAHSVVGSIPGIGPLLKTGKEALGKYKLDKLTEKHLAPPEGGYIYPRTDGP
jgi:hypothetical protein